MEIDPMETADTAREAQESEPRAASLTALVAITVALLATFMGICKVKDDNLVQAMERAQSERLDHWNFYQARNIREEVAKAALAEMQLAAVSAPAAQQTAYRDAIAQYQALAADQNRKKEDLRVQAEADAKTYDALNYRDDQFDLSDAALAIAISMLAVTALTRKRWLFWLALVPTAGGVLMGLAGLMSWHIHPEIFGKLLG